MTTFKAEAKHEPPEKGEIRMARNSYQRGFIQKKNGKYTLRYRVRDPQKGWRERRETLPLGTTEKQARKELDRRIREVNELANDQKRGSSMIFEEFTKGVWADYTVAREIKPSTLYSYGSMLERHILPEIGSLRLSEISVAHLTTFFNKLRESYAAKYVLNVYALLNVMFEVAHQHDLIESIPLRRKIHRPQHQAKKKTALSSDQLREVVQNMDEAHRAFLLILAITGLRLGEVLGLRWQDVDFEAGRLGVRHNLWRRQLVTPKTKGSARVIHMPQALADVLRAHREASLWKDDADFVFARMDGTPYDPDHMRNQVLYPMLDRCGIERRKFEHGFHLFRHTAGSIVHAASRDLKMAQELLGHTRISTTSDIYVHVPEKVAQEATEITAFYFL